MAQARSKYDLFGLDLAQLPAFLRQGWDEALRWPFFARLLTPEPVRLRHPDGGESVWPPGADIHAADTTALLLPEDILLRRTLQLPFLSHGERKEAIELALTGASPFAAGDTVHGWQSSPTASGESIELVLTAREHVARYFGREGADGASEAWAAASTPGAPPIVLQGHGEGARLAHTRRRHLQIVVLAMLIVLLLLALIASPVARMRQDVFDLNDRLEAMGREVAPIIADRDALAHANLQLQAVADYANDRPDPRVALGRLSLLLPDSVYLLRYEQQGRSVRFNGLAENAAVLMESLSGVADFHDVRAPTAINRDPASGRESFSIEFQLASTPDAVAP
ncbi:MAG: PilN domain-containing protein [Azoarcus sp.]|jgi:general secretion pathway protein L|nr:PilN domain-containing protein [Azoarcus sp.]